MGKQAAREAEKLRKALAQAPKALILEIDKELRRTTPVDTGNARANWVPSVGSPAPRGDRAAGTAAVLAYRLDQGALYVSNGVPYIRQLNNGHSKQAPALFVEAAVDVALARVQAKFGAAISIDRTAVIGSLAGGANILGGEMADNLASAYSPFGGDE
jgi:hypothetical protein